MLLRKIAAAVIDVAVVKPVRHSCVVRHRGTPHLPEMRSRSNEEPTFNRTIIIDDSITLKSALLRLGYSIVSPRHKVSAPEIYQGGRLMFQAECAHAHEVETWQWLSSTNQVKFRRTDDQTTV